MFMSASNMHVVFCRFSIKKSTRFSLQENKFAEKEQLNNTSSVLFPYDVNFKEMFF